MISAVLAIIFTYLQICETRGRYEFIDDADLPAFYQMRSAQLAQKAQFAPSQLADYTLYYPYQFYQPPTPPPTPPQTVIADVPNYNPYLYTSLYRPVAPFQSARAAPVHYNPIYLHGTPQSGPTTTNGGVIRKKNV